MTRLHERNRSAGNRLLMCRTARVALGTLVLAAACQVSAASLYRWVEPDGSITYSPEAPPAGVDFDIVDTAALSGNSGIVGGSESPISTTATLPTTGLAVAPPAAPAAEEPGESLSYAPSPDAQTASNPDSGITAAAPDNAATANAAGAATDGAASGITASATKRAQCEELQKRVVSLETRLQSPLTPEDMDNTVLYMARYQQSVDRFCRS